jgi:dTDP-4-amino-4,6-dideoxygalactose transaminase
MPVIAAIVAVGAIPVIVDVKTNLTIDPNLVRIRRGKTKAIIAVHIFGNPCDIGALMNIAQDVPVIEDVSQATGGCWRGRPLGSIGRIAAFSFYPTKPLGAIGDAGAVVTRDPFLAGIIRQMRQYGWNQDRIARHYTGTCSRLDELQAAILTVKLAHLEKMNASRIYIAELYRERLDKFFCHDSYSIYHQCVIRISHRDQLREFLKGHDISTSIHYPVLPWQHPAYKNLCVVENAFMATQAADMVLSLPLWSGMLLNQAEEVCKKVRQWISR